MCCCSFMRCQNSFDQRRQGHYETPEDAVISGVKMLAADPVSAVRIKEQLPHIGPVVPPYPPYFPNQFIYLQQHFWFISLNILILVFYQSRHLFSRAFFFCKSWYFILGAFILLFSYLDDLEPDGRCSWNLLVRKKDSKAVGSAWHAFQ